MSGYTKKRVSAFVTAAGNGWRPGDVITSARWRHPRTIHSIDQHGVCTIGASGRYHGPTFPPDVRLYTREAAE